MAPVKQPSYNLRTSCVLCSEHFSYCSEVLCEIGTSLVFLTQKKILPRRHSVTFEITRGVVELLRRIYMLSIPDFDTNPIGTKHANLHKIPESFRVNKSHPVFNTCLAVWSDDARDSWSEMRVLSEARTSISTHYTFCNWNRTGWLLRQRSLTAVVAYTSVAEHWYRAVCTECFDSWQSPAQLSIVAKERQNWQNTE